MESRKHSFSSNLPCYLCKSSSTAPHYRAHANNHWVGIQSLQVKNVSLAKSDVQQP